MANSTELAAVLSVGTGIGNILEIAANASAAAAAADMASYPPLDQEIRRRVLQTNGFPFILLAGLFLFVVLVKAALQVVWSTLVAICPCFQSLPCCGPDVEYEGVPSFEDAYLEDKLRGAHTYEMRDMPLYKDYFFEGAGTKGGKSTKQLELEEAGHYDIDEEMGDDDVDLAVRGVVRPRFIRPLHHLSTHVHFALS